MSALQMLRWGRPICCAVRSVALRFGSTLCQSAGLTTIASGPRLKFCQTFSTPYSGKASELFFARGCPVLGVEADPRMAEVAGRKGIEVEVSEFERWDARGRSFDLAISAQAWHWLDPEVAPVRAADALRPGGRLALFWNIGRHDPDVRAALTAVYEREAPSLAGETSALGMLPDEREGRLGQLARSGRFEATELRAYTWDATYSRDAWLEFLRTHSDHLQLPTGQRESLLRGVAGVIDRLGGTLIFHFTTVLVLTARSA